MTFFTAIRVRDMSYFTRRLRKKHIKCREEINKKSHAMKDSDKEWESNLFYIQLDYALTYLVFDLLSCLPGLVL